MFKKDSSEIETFYLRIVSIFKDLKHEYKSCRIFPIFTAT